MSESVDGKIIAAPTPIAARVATSESVARQTADAVADAVDDEADEQHPVRPKRSPRLPAGSTTAAKARL